MLQTVNSYVQAACNGLYYKYQKKTTSSTMKLNKFVTRKSVREIQKQAEKSGRSTRGQYTHNAKIGGAFLGGLGVVAMIALPIFNTATPVTTAYADGPAADLGAAPAVASAPAPAKKTSVVNLNFSGKSYTIDGEPMLTNGVGSYDKESKTLSWYAEIDQGMSIGHRYQYQCFNNGSVMERNDGPQISDEFDLEEEYSCSTVVGEDGIPTSVKMTYNGDGFVSETATFTPLKEGEPTSVSRAVVDTSWRNDTYRWCVNYAEAASVTGKVNWGWTGGDPTYWDASKTVILRSSAKNAFGAKIPFVIKCAMGNAGPELVEIIQ